VVEVTGLLRGAKGETAKKRIAFPWLCGEGSRVVVSTRLTDITSTLTITKPSFSQNTSADVVSSSILFFSSAAHLIL